MDLLLPGGEAGSWEPRALGARGAGAAAERGGMSRPGLLAQQIESCHLRVEKMIKAEMILRRGRFKNIYIFK